MKKTEHSYYLTRWIFFSTLGIIYLIAFLSLGVQIVGLLGDKGISPVKIVLNYIAGHYGSERFWQFPTVFWINASDAALQFGCTLGAGLAILLIFGLAPTVISFLLWFLYLSFMVVGQQFLSFQWDALLVETGFLAIFFAGRNIKPVLIPTSTPSIVALWLLRLLLFKLMFSSGMVKLLSGDKTWHDLTALTYHYLTQPLASPLSWYVYHLPVWFHKFSCVLMFSIELIVPFFIFMGRRMRLVAFWANIFLQMIIIFTGNYCFFNLLVIALCFTLLDDGCLKKIEPKGLIGKAQSLAAEKKWKLLETSVAIIVACLIGLVTFSDVIPVIPQGVNNPFLRIVDAVSPFRSVNSYGLFAVMTTKRLEITIEGSLDGIEWKEYEFPWKPGRLDRMPGQVAPHQPRLDWQMWFAALGSVRYNSWVISLMKRLLEGSKPVKALLINDPFAGSLPKYIRANLYDYTFTDPSTRARTGHWWDRKYIRPYTPILSLNSASKN